MSQCLSNPLKTTSEHEDTYFSNTTDYIYPVRFIIEGRISIFLFSNSVNVMWSFSAVVNIIPRFPKDDDNAV